MRKLRYKRKSGFKARPYGNNKSLYNKLRVKRALNKSRRKKQY